MEAKQAMAIITRKYPADVARDLAHVARFLGAKGWVHCSLLSQSSKGLLSAAGVLEKAWAESMPGELDGDVFVALAGTPLRDGLTQAQEVR